MNVVGYSLPVLDVATPCFCTTFLDEFLLTKVTTTQKIFPNKCRRLKTEQANVKQHFLHFSEFKKESKFDFRVTKTIEYFVK